MKIYLDTTVPSYAASSRETPAVEVSRKLFSAIEGQKLEAYVSFVTLREIRDTKNTQKRERIF